MAKKLVLTTQARNDIVSIIDNIIEYTYSPMSGKRLFDDLEEKISLIGFMPEAAGRQRDDGTREAFCRGYRIVYEIHSEEIHILTVIHSRRRYPTAP